MAVVTPLNNPGGPEGDTVSVAEKLLNTEYIGAENRGFASRSVPPSCPLVAMLAWCGILLTLKLQCVSLPVNLPRDLA